MWDVSTNAQTAFSYTHGSPVKDIVYNPHTQLIYSSGFDGQVNFYDPKSNTVVNRITYPNKI